MSFGAAVNQHSVAASFVIFSFRACLLRALL